MIASRNIVLICVLSLACSDCRVCRNIKLT